MRMTMKSILMAGMLLVAGAATAQTPLGYTNGTVARKEGYRFGTGATQGMAVYMSAEKAALLKGKTLSAIRTALGSSQVTDWTLVITKELGGTPVYTQTLSGARTSMAKYALTTPYEFDGDPVYVGYTLNNSTHKTLLFDQSANLPAGLSWVLVDGVWTDVSQEGYGAPNIQLVVDGMEAFTDLMVKPVEPTGYIVTGSAQVFDCQVFNFGTETITSFDVACKIGNGESVTQKVEGISLASGKTYDFQLPEYVSNEVGRLPIEVTISNINGVADAEATPEDNATQNTAYWYPQGVEKKILIETFTGQACGNCPLGHTTVANAISGMEDRFIEVTHHSGYSADYFTMAEDGDYTWYYGEGSTYAPAAMFDRRPIEPGLTSVVFQSNVSTTVKTAVNAFLNVEPYVSVKMSNDFDVTTRTGKVTVEVHTYVEPSEEKHVLNVFLIQNGLVAYQAGASSDYVHNHVFRGALTGNPWGFYLQLVEGETQSYSFDYAIPEFISSSYWGEDSEYGFYAVLRDMYLVALVGDYTGDPMTSWVYNSASVNVLSDEQLAAVEPVSLGRLAVSLQNEGNGVIRVAGECAAIEVYTPAGTLVKTVEAGTSSFVLESGMYVARIHGADGAVNTQKIVVK